MDRSAAFSAVSEAVRRMQAGASVPKKLKATVKRLEAGLRSSASRDDPTHRGPSSPEGGQACKTGNPLPTASGPSFPLKPILDVQTPSGSDEGLSEEGRR